MDKPILSFDIDMTLLDHKTGKITESALKAIEKIRNQYYIVIASGRNMDLKESIVYQDLIKPDAVLHLNGSRVTVGNKEIFAHFFDKILLKRLLEFSVEKQYCVGTSIDGVYYCVDKQAVIKQDIHFWGKSDRTFGKVWELIDKPVHTLCIIGNEKQVKDIEKHFPELKLPMFAGNMGADIIEQKVSKAYGMKQLVKYYETSMKKVIAFGDSMNDYELIKEAGIGIAMGNAIEELKKVADYVTDDIDKDGIWKALEYLKIL